MPRKTDNRSAKGFSLIRPTGMGGIYGGQGYKFQDGYIVCHVPKWLSNPDFVKLMPEGTGDVDVVFRHKKRHVYEHIQIKDHNVEGAEFKKVIETFIQINEGTKDVYRQFTLACPSVGKPIKSLIAKLERYRGAFPLYDPTNSIALHSTINHLRNEFSKLNVSKYADFIVTKIAFDVGKFDFSNDSICESQFASTLASHPRYKKKLIDMLRPAYGRVLNAVTAHRGKVMENKFLHSLVDSALQRMNGGGNSIVLYVHNWTVEKFDYKATVTLDWSKYFDRQNRKVPDAHIWHTKLIPQLIAEKLKLAKKTSVRHIVFRGKCALSTGIALGYVFSSNDNWSFEVIQPPNNDIWNSTASSLGNYKLKYNIIRPSNFGVKEGNDDIVLIFDITGKALVQVINYLTDNKVAVKKIIVVRPKQKPGISSINGDSEAVSLAIGAKNLLKEKLNSYGAKRTHLFFYGPLGLAIFLGQKLSSVGEVQLYEFQEPGYVQSCLLRT